MELIRNYKYLISTLIEYFQYSMERHLLAVTAGILGGAIPNKKSNIHPYLMGAILAILTVKVFVGDYDQGYSWTFSDVGFIILTSLEGVLGAAAIQWARGTA